jgi:hypothetical protein
MEFKGIKGKWSFEQEYDHKYKQESFIISSDEANINTFVSVWSGTNDGIDEARANALLISKAPEMLQLLFELTNDYDTPHYTVEKIQRLIKEVTEL